MPKKQHTEEQINSALRQYERGEKTADICRKQASAKLPSTWEVQYAGLGVQELYGKRGRRFPRIFGGCCRRARMGKTHRPFSELKRVTPTRSLCRIAVLLAYISSSKE